MRPQTWETKEGYMTEFQVVTEKRNNIIILSLQKIKNILKNSYRWIIWSVSFFLGTLVFAAIFK